MPYVNVRITRDGVTPEQKAQIVKDITDSLVRVLGKRPEHTHVIIDEVDPENWGFAGVLTELGLPRAQFVAALLSFNVGVEAGQLAVILLAALLLALPFGKKPWYRARVEVPASLAIAAVAAVWFVQRLGPG